MAAKQCCIASRTQAVFLRGSIATAWYIRRTQKAVIVLSVQTFTVDTILYDTSETAEMIVLGASQCTPESLVTAVTDIAPHLFLCGVVHESGAACVCQMVLDGDGCGGSNAAVVKVFKHTIGRAFSVGRFSVNANCKTAECNDVTSRVEYAPFSSRRRAAVRYEYEGSIQDDHRYHGAKATALPRPPRSIRGRTLSTSCRVGMAPLMPLEVSEEGKWPTGVSCLIIMRMWDRAVYRRSLTFNIEDTTIYQSSSSECYLKTVLLYLHATGSSRTPRPPNDGDLASLHRSKSKSFGGRISSTVTGGFEYGGPCVQTNILTVPLRKHFDMSNTAPSTNITAAQAALDIKYATISALIAPLWPVSQAWFTGLVPMDANTFPAYFFVAIGSLLCQFAQTGLSALRVYGINGRHWGVPLLICVCFIPAIVETIVTMLMSQKVLMIAGIVNVVNAVTSILGAVLTLGATWHHTYRSVRLAHATGEDAPLAMLLLRDGTVYFGASLLIDIFLTAVDFIHTTDSTLILVLDALSPSFAAVILTNFLLNLKSISATSPSLTTVTSFPELQFVGPYDLGGSLVFAGTSGFLHEDTDDSEDHHS
ncbi:hypothetical protein C8Q72DRAFT_796198 [Fomitopsis betulina]|nr:hypothetical protein C8Q72DRAFT_796198 [Fomitopsis betulina]